MKNDSKYMGSVKVGPKGQIVIPNEVRKMFDIKPKDQPVLFADKDRGIVIQRYSVMERIADQIMDGMTNSNEEEEKETMAFAKGIKKIGEEK